MFLYGTPYLRGLELKSLLPDLITGHLGVHIQDIVDERGPRGWVPTRRERKRQASTSIDLDQLLTTVARTLDH